MKKIAIISACVAVVVCVGLFFVLGGMGGTQADIQANLQEYFNAYYKTADIEAYLECFAPEIRDKAEIIQTLGANMNLMANNVMQAKSELGENYTIEVKVTEVSEPTSAGLNAAKGKFSGAQMVVAAGFELTLKGDEKITEHTGTAAFVKIGNKWYLGDTSVLTYPKN